MPLPHPELIAECSLGETQTPLIRSNRIGPRLGLNDLRLKVEIGPTLSLKDRGSSLCSLKALELGFEAMCVASSGNNASSVAAYAARAGLPAVVFVQRDVATAKFTKMSSYGAKVVRVDGNLSQAGRMCSHMLERKRWMDCGGPNPYRIAAKRLVAYEIIAQLQGEVPDAVIFPCGGCAGIVAAHSGFRELMEMGLIRQMPRLIGVQLTACDPVTQAFEKDRIDVSPVDIKPTISDALTNSTPYWGNRAIVAARETGGFFFSVTDEDVTLMAAEIGAAEGLYLEPAGAAAPAGLGRALNENRMQQMNRVVCTVTGHGLNARQLSTWRQDVPEPIAPDPDEVADYLGI
ncbi:MAG: threonine synthase [Desulfobacterales bacterium]